MRELVKLTFGGREYPLLPTFGVLEKFEARFGSLPKQLMAMMDMSATLRVRAYLVFLGIKAQREDDDTGEARGELSWDAVAEAMFDEGVLNEAMTLLEVEFMERLLYTPEQYQTKKTQRAALEAEMARLQAASNTSLDLLSQISNGSPQSSTAAHPESSSPP
jgi:hypothetical protein